MKHVKLHIENMFYESLRWEDESFAEYLFFEYKELFGEYIGDESIVDILRNTYEGKLVDNKDN